MSELNPTLKDTQFADYHGHGWNFRAVFKRDRKGNLLDADGRVVADDDPAKFQKAVHLSSIHVGCRHALRRLPLRAGRHGNGHLYGEVAQAVEIDCKDCHGTATAYPTLRTSGPAAGPNGNDLSVLRNPDGRRRFEWRGRQAVPALGARPEARMGSVTGEGQRDAGESRTTTRRPRARS